MEETPKGLAPWDEVKKTLSSPPDDPVVEQAWEDMNNYVLSFVLSLLM